MTEPAKEPRLCPKHKAPYDVDVDCHVCHGEGEIEDLDDFMGGFERCWSCHGSGMGFPECAFCIEEEGDDI